MLFSHGTQQRLNFICSAAAVFAAISAALAFFSSAHGDPYIARFAHWAMLIPVALAICIALEIGGIQFLENRHWRKIPAAARVPLLVLILVAAVSAVAIGIK